MNHSKGAGDAMEVEALWKEQRDFSALSVSAGEGEGHDTRAFEHKTLCSGPRTIHHHARPGLVAESHSAEIPVLPPQFIYISSHVALTGGKGIPGEKCNYVIYFLQKTRTQYRRSVSICHPGNNMTADAYVHTWCFLLWDQYTFGGHLRLLFSTLLPLPHP